MCSACSKKAVSICSGLPRGPSRVLFLRCTPGDTTLSELGQSKMFLKVGTLSYNWSTIGSFRAFHGVALPRFPGGPAALYLKPILGLLNKCVHTILWAPNTNFSEIWSYGTFNVHLCGFAVLFLGGFFAEEDETHG